MNAGHKQFAFMTGMIKKKQMSIYNLEELIKFNYHIHTNISSCAQSDMTLANIMVQAEQAGLREIALVDHHHRSDCDVIGNVTKLRNELQTYQAKVKVLIGAELSAYGVGKYSDTEAANKMLDYRLYACNHYHLPFWEHPRTCSPRAYAEHALEVLEALIKSERADCIAHPFVAIYLKDRLFDYTAVTRAISDQELADILELGRNFQVAWEINTKATWQDLEFSKRYWKIGNELGVIFKLGTDAHCLTDIDPKQFAVKFEAML